MSEITEAPPLPLSRKILCTAYAAISVIALIATWSQNLAYQNAAADMFTSFLRETRVTAASRSITADILLFFLAAAIFMVVEGRKHGVRLIWAYIVGGVFIAISVTFPLFLIAREVKMAGTAAAPAIKAKDSVLLALLAVLLLGTTLWVDAG